jgi:hypothetical protein
MTPHFQTEKQAIATLCRNLSAWEDYADDAGWQARLSRAVAAARQGNGIVDAVAELEAVEWLLDNLPELQRDADAGGWRADLDSRVAAVVAGGSAVAELNDLGFDLGIVTRGFGSAGSAGLWPDRATQSEFRCPREEARCDRREARDERGRWPVCALENGKPLKPGASSQPGS